jgi:branched-chain amino acid transport system ATP-binding protein
VKNINVYYGKLQVLWDVSFKVEEGEIVSLVGSNGAGKTTTLRTISGLLHPPTGTIEFLGERIDRLPSHKIVAKGVAHVPEGRGIFSHLTVTENLKIGAYTSNAWKKKEETVKFVHELFPILEERKNQIAGTLSGGERQMLAIARALMSKPKLLMLDEPSLGLAPKIVMQIFDLLKKVSKEGITILLVEQNVWQALELANRSYVLETGRVTLEGTGKGLLENDQVKKAYLGL